MSEITLNGRQFALGEMNVLHAQLHVYRRLAPAQFELMRIFKGFEAGFPAEVVLITTFDDWTPFLAKLSDADMEYIRDACLRTVRIFLNGLWVDLYPAGGKLADSTLELMDIMMLMGAVIKKTFLPFFNGLAQQSPQQGPKTGD